MSGYSDSNTGPSGPKPDALANCATPRIPDWDCKYKSVLKKNKVFPEKLLTLEKYDPFGKINYKIIRYA